MLPRRRTVAVVRRRFPRGKLVVRKPPVPVRPVAFSRVITQIQLLILVASPANDVKADEAVGQKRDVRMEPIRMGQVFVELPVAQMVGALAKTLSDAR
jgi:hypothetical protein